MTHLCHERLRHCGVEHGFGLRGAPELELARPRQVHGIAVVSAAACASDPPPVADAVTSDSPGRRIGVVTADCVPILAASADGSAVAAIHAGWRGLAAGVVAAGVDALATLAGPGVARIAVIGPHIGPCCYEVDAPVLEALESRFADALAAATHPARPGHAMLDLGCLVRWELEAHGMAAESIDSFPDACTACHPERFHSFRRDGERAGRMQHYIAACGVRLPREA